MFVRRSILDRRPVQNLLVVAALVICVVMLIPSFSPVLGKAATARALLSARPWAALQTGIFVRPPGPPPPVTFGTMPLPKASTARRTPGQVKGILLNGYSAGGSRFDDLLDLVKRTELNAVVIDVKDERGEISWMPRTPMARLAGAGVAKILNASAMVTKLHRAGVYAIGRVVAFRDAKLAAARPDLALQDTRGGAWHTLDGLPWADPYSAEVQDYNIAVAVEALEAGFDEIQFDYVQFPTDGDIGRIWSRYADGRARSVVLRDFLVRARAQIAGRGRYTSVDAFGDTVLTDSNPAAAQDLRLMASAVDYVSPMIWPETFPKPSFGLFDPERDPGLAVAAAVRNAKQRIAGTRATLRPWLQDFTQRIPYTPVEVSAQITAAERAGTRQWLLWNALNRYSEDALRPSPDQKAPPPASDKSTVSR
jgi:hypothetical protein